MNRRFLPLIFATALLWSLVVSFDVHSTLAQETRQDGRLMRDEGIRYLKLGGTYREAQNYDLALKYVTKGLQMVSNLGSRYWEAVGYENLGLIYRDMGDKQGALDNLRRASSIYDRIIRQKDGNGSNTAVRMLIDDVEQGADKSALLRDELQRQQAANKALNQRISELETRIRQLEIPVKRPTAGADLTPNIFVDKTPQGQYAPYSVDKKPVPRRATDTVMKPLELPKLVLQLGIGAGIGLQSTTGVVSVPLVSLSADYFLADAFSVGLIGAYSFGTPRYQFVGLRAAYHYIRSNTFDSYAGLSGGVVWPSPALQWYGGVLLGAQFNFTSFLGVFVDFTLGAASNTYAVPTAADDGTITTTQKSAIGFGGYGRAGISFSF